jgi:DNA replication protein DnaC
MNLDLLGIDPYFDALSEGVAPSLVDLIASANRMAMHKVMCIYGAPCSGKTFLLSAFAQWVTDRSIYSHTL